MYVWEDDPYCIDFVANAIGSLFLVGCTLFANNLCLYWSTVPLINILLRMSVCDLFTFYIWYFYVSFFFSVFISLFLSSVQFLSFKASFTDINRCNETLVLHRILPGNTLRFSILGTRMFSLFLKAMGKSGIFKDSFWLLGCSSGDWRCGWTRLGFSFSALMLLCKKSFHVICFDAGASLSACDQKNMF